MASILEEVTGFDKSLNRLADLIRHASKPKFDLQLGVAMVEYSLLKLHDAWSFRCRQIVLKSAIGGYLTSQGSQLHPAKNLPSKSDPLIWLRTQWSKKKMPSSWEPDWFVPANAIRAAQLLGTANFTMISAGFGASTAAEQVRTVRNLIAHSLPNTWARYRHLTLARFGKLSPYDMILTLDPTTGKNHFSVWAADLRASLMAACA